MDQIVIVIFQINSTKIVYIDTSNRNVSIMYQSSGNVSYSTTNQNNTSHCVRTLFYVVVLGNDVQTGTYVLPRETHSDVVKYASETRE